VRDIILLAGTGIAALVGLFRPSFGLLTFIFLGVFGPQSLTWGFARTFPFSQVIAVSTLLGICFSSERKTMPGQRELLLLVLLWIFMGISTLFALEPDKASEQYLNISKIFSMIVITCVLINTEAKLRSLIRVIGLSLGFYGLKGGVFAVASGGALVVFGPESTFLYANNSIGLALAMNIPILLYLLKREQSSWLRFLIRAMVIFSYPAIICTYSRGAWIGMGVATLLSVLQSRKKFIAVGAATLVTMLLVAILPQVTPDRLKHRYDDLIDYDEEDSAQSRFWNWEFCKRVGFARPFTGGGFDFYKLETYARYYPEFQERWPGKVWSCHSMWLTVFGEQGVIGSVIWLSLLACCMRSLKRFGLNAVSAGEKQSRLDFVNMVKSSMVTYFVVGTFLDAAYFDLFYYFIAFVVIQKGIIAATAKDAAWTKTARDTGLLEPASQLGGV
jgi:probable O-glycosylation ligase (exosortase A-associated)